MDNLFKYDLNNIKVPENKKLEFKYVKYFFERIGNPNILYVSFNDDKYSIIIGFILGDMMKFEFCFKIHNNIPEAHIREV